METVKKYSSFEEIKASETAKNTNTSVLDQYALLVSELRSSIRTGSKKNVRATKKAKR